MEAIFTKTKQLFNISFMLLALCWVTDVKAQLNFTDDFSANTSATYTTTGAIGTSEWSVLRSAADWGARRNIAPTDQLQLTNDVGAAFNANGWVFAQTSSRHHPLLNQNTTVTWNFNMRQSQADPGGFVAGSYGVAYVLAGQNTTTATAGNGYAIVVGQIGTGDPVKLIRYTAGLQGTQTVLISSNTAGLADFGTEYLSIRVVYTAATNTWQLLVRNDGTTAFTDPKTGTLTSQGTFVDATYTSSPTTLGLMGAYYQGSIAVGQTAFFDNVSVDATTNAFVTTWIPGGTNTTLAIPITGTGYNYNVYCQNMTTPTTAVSALTAQTGSATFSALTSASTYRVFITGTFPRVYFIGFASEAPKLRTIDNWGNIAWTNMSFAFYGCNNLIYNTTNIPILSGVTDMSNMFANCTIFNGAIGTWNTATVTNMSRMFLNANSFNQPIGSWNTSAVTNMSHMFNGAGAFNQAIGTWNTAAVTDMRGMFSYAPFNQPIDSWNTANVTNMSFMFRNAASFNQPIGSWNTSAVTDMSFMFYSTTSFNQPINTWNTAAVTNMSGMFQSATAFNQLIDTWNTFAVTNMSSMFQSATAFNQPIGTWNTAAVTNMSSMFSFASAFNKSIGTWNTAAVTNMANMLDNCGMSLVNYDNTLMGWSANVGLQNGIILGANNLKYCVSEPARLNLISSKGWTFVGDAKLCPNVEINVVGNAISIVDGDITPNLADHTDFGTVVIPASINRVFTIQNTGTAPLDVTSITLSGSGAGSFLISGLPSFPFSVGIGGSQNFTVTFTPASTCLAETATITILNYDSDETVYDFVIQGTSYCPAPEINIVGNATSIVDGDISPSITDHTDFGTVALPSSFNRVFTIQNTGIDPLTLTSIALSGADAGDFSISGLPAFPIIIAAGASQNLTVTFTPSTICALKTATITINSDDADESVYDFVIQGFSYCPVPEINVVGNAVSIVDGDIAPSTTDHTDFGAVVITSNFNRVFTIQSMGPDPLTLTSLALSGPNAGDFSISGLPAFPIIIAAGGIQNFTVTFTPSGVGVKNATITINNNDANESVYDFAIVGLGISNYITIASGNWNLSSTWLAGAIPASDGDVIVAHTVDLDMNYNIGAYTLTVQNNKSLNIKNTRTLTIPAGGTLQNNGIVISNVGGTLINSGTINNAGILHNKQLCTNNATLQNTGIINNTSSFNNVGTSTLNNSGTINNNTGNFVNTATITNPGVFNNNSTAFLTNNGLFDNPWGIYNNNFGATLNGAGTYNGYLANDGTFAPGNSPGVFTINGLFVNNGIIQIEIGGDNGPGDPNGHDRIVVNGDVYLDGEVQVTLINSFLPANGSTYNFIQADNVFFTFATETLPSSGWSVPYTSTTANATLNESLPIELLYFNAQRQDIDNVRLDWATSLEINNQGFEIQRMLDNETEFKTIAWVDGAGNTTLQQNYERNDANSYPAISYYRLKQVDFDGTFTYSPTRAVEGQKSASDIVLMPNPTSDVINIRFGDFDATTTRIVVYAADGKIVLNKEVPITSYQVLTLEETKDFPTGTYFLQAMLNDGTNYTAKFVKLI